MVTGSVHSWTTLTSHACSITPTYNPTRTTHPHSGFLGPAPHLPWPPPRPFLSSPDDSLPRFGRGGCRRRGAGGPSSCRAEAPREQLAKEARGGAARGRRLPSLEPVAARAHLPLPGSEGRGPMARKGRDSGGHYGDGTGSEPPKGDFVLCSQLV